MSKPLVATYWLLADEYMPDDANIIPPEWRLARFDTTDILYVCSFFVLLRNDPNTGQRIYKFGLQDGHAGNGWLGKYEKRYKWVVTEARTQNPSIKIIASMMMYNSETLQISDLEALTTPEARTEFAMSVRDLLLDKSKETYINSTQNAVSARIDGFDIDIEDGNFQSWLPETLAKLRCAFDFVRPAQKFYLSVTPCGTTYLDNSCAWSLDYINMQNYDGGDGTDAETYKSIMPDLKESQIFWGLSSEHPGSLNSSQCQSVSDALDRCREGNLAGVMTWRLNSGNWVYQQMLQLNMYARMKEFPCPGELETLVANGWAKGGTDNARKDEPVVPVEPYRMQDWVARKEWREVQFFGASAERAEQDGLLYVM